MNQTHLHEFFEVTADSRDTKSKQIERLYTEALYCYKLRLFRYDVDNIPAAVDRRTMWYLLELTLARQHCLNPSTFQLIIQRRGLTAQKLRETSFNMWMDNKDGQFDQLSSVAVLNLIFSPAERALASGL
jgi:hypothetical protein